MDDFQFWRDALAGKPVVIEESSPQPGYYKIREGRDGPWVPVAIWRHEGELVCRVGNERRDPMQVWLWAAKHPVAKDAAKTAFDTGQFPGEIGHNLAAGLPLTEEIEEVAHQAVAWLDKNGITDATSKDMAANYKDRLLDLRKSADLQREVEKRPHLEASRAVDAKWKPSIDLAQISADRLREALTVYMRAELAAEEKRRAAEVARQKAEHEAYLKANPMAEYTAEPEPEIVAAPVKVQAGGQRGRKTGLRTVTRVVVKDHAAALAFFAESDDVRELVQKLAERATKAGVKVPGAEVVTEKVAA